MILSRSYVLFSAQYPPHLGGIENFTRGLAETLVGQGHDVTVVTNDTEGLGSGFVVEGGVRVLRLPCYSLISGRFPLPRLTSSHRELIEELEAMRFDGVLVNARFYPHSLFGMRFARKMGLRPVVLDHGSAWLSFSSPILDPLARLYERMMTTLGKRYDPAYFGISQKSVEWLATFGIQAEGVIPNSIDAVEYRLSSGRNFRKELGLSESAFLIAFVGRLIPEKGVRQIIEVAKERRFKSEGAVFILAGDGPLSDEVRAAQCESLRWVGRLSREDTSALFQEADVMCLPSRSEGFSTTLLEASACGCPSVITDVGGARELIPDKRFGTILPDDSAETLSRTLLMVMEDRSTLRLQSDNAMRRCASYSREALASRCAEVLEGFC